MLRLQAQAAVPAAGQSRVIRATLTDLGVAPIEKVKTIALSLPGAARTAESAGFLDSGVYHVEIKGTVESAGGGFSGEINTTPIPEPSKPLLLLASLGVMGTLSNRLRSQA